MGKYTLRGGPEFDLRVDQDLATITKKLRALPEAKDFLGVVLLGGYGRGEGTPLIKGDQQLPFNDYDLIVVGRDMCDWRRRKLQQRLNEVAPELSLLVELPVDLCLYAFNSLPLAEPSLLNAELKHGHRVLWGSQELLTLMPNYSFRDVPLLEGTRLLMNRGVLLLYLKDRYASLTHLVGDERLEAIKYIQKNYLAFGDCLLMLEGTYQLEYHQKRHRIHQVEKGRDCPRLDWVQQRYLEAIEFKDWGDPLRYEGQDLERLWEDCRQVWAQFFLWFESYRLGMEITELTSYLKALEEHPDEAVPLWKVVGLNLFLFRFGAIRPNRNWLWIHPRSRVFAALWAFLAQDERDVRLSMLLGRGETKEELQQRLFQLRSRLS